LIFAGGCVLAALVFMIPALGFPGTSVDGAPGPGYFPVIVSAVIIVLAITLAVTYLRHKEKYFQTNENERSNLPTLLVTGGAIVLYTILFMALRSLHLFITPFIPLTIVFLGFLNWLYKRKWVYNGIFSVVFTLVLYFVFSKFLHVML
jgi:hypothetical protein